MKLILKTKDLKQLAVVECWVRTDGDFKYIGLSSFVDIKNYSELLLSVDEDTRQNLIKSFNGISHMKEYLNSYNDYHIIVAECREILRYIRNKYNFIYQERNC